MEKEYRKLSELRHWDKNPKTADRAGIDRLKQQIQLLGVYKPLMITPDGEVIGGNQRLTALEELARELGGDGKVWVHIVDPKDEEEKVSLAMSDNEQAGHYDEKKLYALLNRATNLPYHFFAIDLGYTINTPAPVDTTRDVSTVKEAHETYLNNDEKQITLFFYEGEYEKVNGLLKEAQEHYGVGTPELAVIALLDEFAPL